MQESSTTPPSASSPTSRDATAVLREAFLEEYASMRKMAADASAVVRPAPASASTSSSHGQGFDGLDGAVIMCMYDELVRLRKRVAVYERVIGDVESAVKREGAAKSSATPTSSPAE